MHTFLSQEWIDAAIAIRDEFIGQSDMTLPSIRINLVVSEVPFDGGAAEASIDTTRGSTSPQLGLLDEADATITLDYRTAHALLVERDPQVAMMAFMTGQILVDGDLAKVMALQQIEAPQPAQEMAAEVHRRILEVTAPLVS